MFFNKALNQWIRESAKQLRPRGFYLCDGSLGESKILQSLMMKSGTINPLTDGSDSFIARTDPSDVARVEDQTFICSYKQSDAGPTNNWKDPEEMKGILAEKMKNAMLDRNMYVIPFMLGPYGNPFSCKIGVQITDSPYVVANMRIMTKMGQEVTEMINNKSVFSSDKLNIIKCLHTVGNPTDPGFNGSRHWPCSSNKYICHFPGATNPANSDIISYGSGYGGNALLSKKCLALRIASTRARREGWLAEHMFILSVTNPQGEKKYFAGAFPSSCGKTNMAMLKPPNSLDLKGWKVEVVGDDIAWIRVGDDGHFYAINPESGFFGVAQGTSEKCNPYMMKTLERDVIYTNCADLDTPEGNMAWWHGKEIKEIPQGKSITDWRGNTYLDVDINTIKNPLNHPNARFTVSKYNCPVLDESAEHARGVKLSGIIFGGRRSDTVPLIYQASNWVQGVIMGATLDSETTSASSDVKENIRYDPFAMLPFCGYNIVDYFDHWLGFGKYNTPEIFKINVFRKDENGKFIWPGFGENMRLLKWMFEACDNSEKKKGNTVQYKQGIFPKEGSIPGVDPKISRFDLRDWENEKQKHIEYLNSFGKDPAIQTMVKELQEM